MAGYGKDGANVGTLDALAFSSVPNLNAAAQWRRLSECRRFIEAGFGEIDPWRNHGPRGDDRTMC
jgi:hypothetical protein